MAKGGQHPGFKAVQGEIAAKEGVSEERAGAILAASSRRASPAAKRANPRLSRVKGNPNRKKGKKPSRGAATTTAYMGGSNFKSY